MLPPLPTHRATWRALNATLLLMASCVGAIDGASAPEPTARPPAGPGAAAPTTTPGAPTNPAGPRPVDPATGKPAAACTAVSPGPAPIRRLTRAEYNATVRDLLGDDTRPADAFPAEELGNGFGNDANALTVSRLLAEQYAAAARAVADRVVADPARLAGVLGCDPATAGEAACARTFIGRFGARAYRRPLTNDEITRLMTAYGNVRALPQDFRGGVSAVLQVMLQAPQFLYRVEAGVPDAAAGGALRLSPYEMASRLSYLLWGTMPDAALFAAADAGKLSTRQEVRAQAERMLASPLARDPVRMVHEVIFEVAGADTLQKDASKFPEFTPEVPALLKQESERFIDSVIWEGAGDLGTLLTGSFTFANAKLAAFYGASMFTGPMPAGTSFDRVAMNPGKRAGLLTHAGVMASVTSGDNTPVRGNFVRRNLLCSPPPDPPPGAIQMAPKVDDALTSREKITLKTAAPACAGCHALLNPFGFAFENYSSIGKWRDTENGRPVDASAELVGTDVAGPVSGPADLARKLAGSGDVARCYVGHWLSFAYGRSETDQDRCSRLTLEDAFAASNGRVKDLLLALTQTDAFLYRPQVQP